jgi:hypothetical protein
MKIVKSKRYYNRPRKSLSYNKKGGSSRNCVYNPDTQKMEGECPGLKYLKEVIPNGKQDPNSVYIMLGHGCDLEDEELTVPTDCEYYTTVACGIKSAYNQKMFKDFFNNTLDLTKPDIYKYNSPEKSDSKYPMFMYTGEQNLYKRKSGDEYVNSLAYPFVRIGFYAGLHKMGSIISDNMYINETSEDPNFIGLIPPKIAKSKDIIRPYTLEFYYLQHFTGSIFPTTTQVCKLLHENFTENELNSFKYPLFGQEHDKFMNLIKNNFIIDYASIMEFFKGRFINPNCRIICRGSFSREEIIPEREDPEKRSFVALRRSKSARLPFEWYDVDDEAAN